MRIAITGAVGFFVLGVLVSVIGPTLPEMRERHGLGATGAAMLPAAYAGGSAIGVGLAGWLRHRVPVARLLSIGAVALAIGCAGLPVAPNGVAAGACLLFAGVGLGVVDLLLNLVLATAYGSGSGAVLSAVSATFGVSAVLTPLLVGRAPDELGPPYFLCAAGAIGLLALTTTLRPARTSPPIGRRATAAEMRTVVLLGIVLLGYVAIEAGVAGWETTHLLAATSLSKSASANAVALFWLGLTVGRLIGAPLALRWHPSQLAIGSLILSTLSLAVATHAPYAVAAYAVTGLLVAPIFPAVITWHAAAVPSGRGATRVFAAGLAGPVIGSPIIGLAADQSTAAVVPWVLTAFALLTAVVAVAARRHTGGAR